MSEVRNCQISDVECPMSALMVCCLVVFLTSKSCPLSSVFCFSDIRPPTSDIWSFLSSVLCHLSSGPSPTSDIRNLVLSLCPMLYAPCSMPYAQSVSISPRLYSVPVQTVFVCRPPRLFQRKSGNLGNAGSGWGASALYIQAPPHCRPVRGQHSVSMTSEIARPKRSKIFFACTGVGDPKLTGFPRLNQTNVFYHIGIVSLPLHRESSHSAAK